MNNPKIVWLIFLTLFALSGCNSDMADLSPLLPKNPFFFQLGAITGQRFETSELEDICQSIVVDQHQNTYCSGTSQNGFTREYDGSADAYIMKLDYLGRFVWIKEFGSSNAQFERIAMLVIGPDGDIYGGGQTRGMLAPTPDSRLDTGAPRTVAETDPDGIIIKISTDGEVRYIKQFGTSDSEGCGNLAVSKSGNIFCVGGTTGIIGHDSSGNLETRENDTPLNTDLYAIKFDKDLNILWRRQIGSTDYPGASDFPDRCSAIALDENENIFCGGVTEGSLADTHGGSTDILLWSMNASGETRFLSQIGEIAEAHPDVNDSASEDFVGHMSIAQDGSLYIVGDTFTLGTPAMGDRDIMVLKFNPAGSLEWLKQYGTVSTDRALASVIDLNNNLIVAGTTRSSFIEDLGGGADIFIGKIGPDSSLISFKQFGGITKGPGNDTSKNDYCHGLAIDHMNNIYCGGATESNFAEQASSLDTDILIFRLNPDLSF